MEEPGADDYDSHLSRQGDSDVHSFSDDSEDMLPPNASGAPCNQMYPYHQEYHDWQRKRNKKRDSISIEGVDSSDDEQPVVTVKARVSD